MSDHLSGLDTNDCPECGVGKFTVLQRDLEVGEYFKCSHCDCEALRIGEKYFLSPSETSIALERKEWDD